MRCPKCGYISFDHLESCKKCKKTISGASETLNGTIYDSAAPLFLQFAVAEEDGDIALLEPMTDMDSMSDIPEINFEDDEEEFDLDSMMEEDDDPILELDDAGLEDSEEISLEEEWEDDEVVMSLDDLEEVAPRDEFTLDIEGEDAEEEPQTPGMDFSEIDISDLAPPSEDAVEDLPDIPGLEEISDLETTTPASEGAEEDLADDIPGLEAMMESEPEPEPVAMEEELVEEVEEEMELVAELSDMPLEAEPVAVKKSSSTLEDLSLDELDLDGPLKPVTGSASSRKLAPSVKTGTALDEFSVDLGELFSDKKE